jgi:hypothetical protein
MEVRSAAVLLHRVYRLYASYILSLGVASKQISPELLEPVLRPRIIVHFRFVVRAKLILLAPKRAH